MKKVFLSILSLGAFAIAAHAQYSEFSDLANESASKYTISSDNNILQIGGRVSGYYERRSFKDDYNDRKRNTFSFKDIDLDFYGKSANKFVYEIQLSMLDLVNASAIGNGIANQSGSNVDPNPYNTGFKAAYLQYRGWPVHIKFGFDKLPYSQSSISDVWSTPNWSHPILVGGDIFSRRDLGITLNYRAWNNRLNFYAGAYSGLGENVFQYGGDASGKLEYIGRAEFCWPGKVKYNMIDHEISPKPTFRVAVNARYADKTQPAGHTIAEDVPDAPGPYGTRIFNGKRLMYGADGIFKYKGLSVTLEGHLMDMRPSSQGDLLYYGTTESFNKNKVKGGGIEAGVNYNAAKFKSVFSVNYENFNANDLEKGHEEWLYIGYAYKVSGFNSVVKVQYYKALTEDENLNPLRYTSRVRVGYQVIF